GGLARVPRPPGPAAHALSPGSLVHPISPYRLAAVVTRESRGGRRESRGGWRESREPQTPH
ncbi:MAG TPA: hypothetical protein VK586_19855, partial [Streptosporangiaceae bacterium]|nr:hypothetical protein [Streptosporangiaceae bacterium]